MKNRIRYTVDKVLSNQFYQMPKFLFEDEFKKLSNDARVLYTLLKDRHELSVKNEWYNEKGEVYLIMTRDEMESMLGLSAPTVRKAINELKALDLIEEERQGLNKPNLLYLLDCKNLSIQKNRNFTPGLKKNYSPESKNFYPNHTNLKNHTDLSYTDSINQQEEPIDTIKIKETVKEKIALDNLKQKYSDKKKELQELYDIIVEILASRRRSLHIAKENMPAYAVKQAFSSLDSTHIEYVLECLRKNTTKVKNIKAYLQTALFNSVKTISNHYSLSAQNFLFDKLGIDPV